MSGTDEVRATTFPSRMSTGVPGLDSLLGGGLIPGTLTVVLGATGAGKTQLGLQFAGAGIAAEGRRGIILDTTVRGDSQGHEVYARRLFDWRLAPVDAAQATQLEGFFERARSHADYLRIFDGDGLPPHPAQREFDAWRDRQARLSRRLAVAIAFFYGNFARGVRRAVIDGVDPVDDIDQSIQFELFDYVYRQVLQKESDWVARDLFRQEFRRHAAAVATNAYDHRQITALLLCTSRDVLLDELIERPLDERDWLATANTVIVMGRIRAADRVARGLYIAKHRGSACADSVVHYTIGDAGLRIG